MMSLQVIREIKKPKETKITPAYSAYKSLSPKNYNSMWGKENKNKCNQSFFLVFLGEINWFLKVKSFV